MRNSLHGLVKWLLSSARLLVVLARLVCKCLWKLYLRSVLMMRSLRTLSLALVLVQKSLLKTKLHR
jgi:hypothetical protein